MRLFGYYAFHALKNQIKKLLKTWVLIFVLVCAVLGAAIGVGAALLTGAVEDAGELPEELETLDEPEPEDDTDSFFVVFDVEPESLTELIVGLVILIVFLIDVLGADKNGGRIFLPADVNLLFPSPMKPQSVLLFRLATQMGLTLFISIYLLAELRGLSNLGIRGWSGVATVFAWGLAVMVGRLLQILLYTLCSNHPPLRANLRRGVYISLALVVGGFALFLRQRHVDVVKGAMLFFNSGVTRWIPFWGWIKGFVIFAVKGDALRSLGFLGLTLLGGAALVWIIWNVKADFYEDAMAKSEETAELLERAQSEEAGVSIITRKKDRSERLRRDGMRHGWGASVFFFKTLYNRFRFAHLGVLTKTMETYLVAAAAMSFFCRYALELRGSLPVALLLAGIAFFRALGNPLERDTKMAWFLLIPETCRKKLLWSLLGGTACCFLDVLPAMLLAALLLGENVLVALAWIPFIVSVDFYATCVGAFIGLSVPTAAGRLLKQIVQVMFIYFGLVPDAVILAVGLIMWRAVPAVILAAALNAALGLLFFWFTPLFLDPNGGKDASFGMSYSQVGGE